MLVVEVVMAPGQASSYLTFRYCSNKTASIAVRVIDIQTAFGAKYAQRMLNGALIIIAKKRRCSQWNSVIRVEQEQSTPGH
jgi:hypothetical protein